MIFPFFALVNFCSNIAVCHRLAIIPNCSSLLIKMQVQEKKTTLARIQASSVQSRFAKIFLYYSDLHSKNAQTDQNYDCISNMSNDKCDDNVTATENDTKNIRSVVWKLRINYIDQRDVKQQSFDEAMQNHSKANIVHFNLNRFQFLLLNRNRKVFVSCSQLNRFEIKSKMSFFSSVNCSPFLPCKSNHFRQSHSLLFDSKMLW